MIFALIVAAGKGLRFGEEIPKQFLMCKNRPILYYTIKAFEDNKNIDQIIIVASPDYIDLVKSYINKYELKKVTKIVEGGPTRQLSVFNGLKAIKEISSKGDKVLIHDGARPLISQNIIEENILALTSHSFVCTVQADADTTYLSKDQKSIDSILNREELFLAQTPQSFDFDEIYKLHFEAFKNNDINNTDDASLALKNNRKVFLVQGNKYNFKITKKEDFHLFELLI